MTEAVAFTPSVVSSHATAQLRVHCEVHSISNTGVRALDTPISTTDLRTVVVADCVWLQRSMLHFTSYDPASLAPAHETHLGNRIYTCCESV